MTKNKQAEIVLKASNKLQDKLSHFGTDNVLIDYTISGNNLTIALLDYESGINLKLYSYEDDGEVSTINKLVLHCEVRFNDFYRMIEKIYDILNK